MNAFWSHATIDCHDALALSEWWEQVLGYADREGDPNQPGHDECMIRDPTTGHRLLFIEVPDASEAKRRSGKNRLHLDLRPRKGTRDKQLAVLKTGNGYVLSASDASLTPSDSRPFDISAGPATGPRRLDGG